MKDAKGHGSNKRGAHSAGLIAAVPRVTKDEFAQIVAESQARSREAGKLLNQLLATENKQAVFESGDRKVMISKSLDPAYDLRATNFDAKGPSGHREYKLTELKGLKDEIFQALVGGYKLRSLK